MDTRDLDRLREAGIDSAKRLRNRHRPGRFVFGALFVFLQLARPAADDAGLVAAARERDLQQVRTLLSARIDANVRSADGSTALIWAAHWNDLEAAGLLIGAGADPNAANDFGMTALSLACTNGSPAMVDRLLNAGANPNTSIATGETPTMTCAGAGSLEAVRMLIAHGADVDAKQPSQDQTALMWAAAERHPEIVKALILAGAPLEARSKKGFTALHFAAREGDLEISRLLLDAGVSVDIRSEPLNKDRRAREGGGGVAGGSDEESAGSTPLLVAAVRGHVPLALFFLEQGADPNVGDAGFTVLHWAAGMWETGVSNPVYGFVDPMSGIPDRKAKVGLVNALLQHGADPNARITRRPPGFAGGYSDVVGATPFLLASSVADMEIMRLLHDAGADPAVVTGTKATTLMAAAGLNHTTGETAVTEAQALEAVKFLLDLGADATAVTSLGENALFGPAYHGWNRVLELLIAKGADVNIVSKAGITPWLAASGMGDRLGGVLFNREGADLLVRHGADPKLGKPCQAQNRCR
jgi:ankyrin repeat protein